jgi:hypothetical protein
LSAPPSVSPIPESLSPSPNNSLADLEQPPIFDQHPVNQEISRVKVEVQSTSDPPINHVKLEIPSPVKDTRSVSVQPDPCTQMPEANRIVNGIIKSEPAVFGNGTNAGTDEASTYMDATNADAGEDQHLTQAPEDGAKQ